MSELVEYICIVLRQCQKKNVDISHITERNIRTFLRQNFPKFSDELKPHKLDAHEFMHACLRKMLRMKRDATLSEEYMFVKTIVTNEFFKEDDCKAKRRNKPPSEVGTYISETTQANERCNMKVVY